MLRETIFVFSIHEQHYLRLKYLKGRKPFWTCQQSRNIAFRVDLSSAHTKVRVFRSNIKIPVTAIFEVFFEHITAKLILPISQPILRVGP